MLTMAIPDVEISAVRLFTVYMFSVYSSDVTHIYGSRNVEFKGVGSM